MDVPPGGRAQYGTGKMLMVTPRLVDALIRTIPKGRLATVNQIRGGLAAGHTAGSTCPLTTGIFILIAAEAAEEGLLLGETDITPTCGSSAPVAPLNEKFPGSMEAQSQRLAREGHTIEPGRGMKPLRVAGFEKRLVTL